MEKDRKTHRAIEDVNRPKSNQKLCFAMIMLLANRFQTKLDSYTGEITLKQWLLICMFVNMRSETASVNDLAEVVGYSRQNVKKMVDILVRKGYMDLKTSSVDKRAYEVKLTQKARDFFAGFEPEGDELIGQLFGGVSEDELETAGRVLVTALKNIEKM